MEYYCLEHKYNPAEFSGFAFCPSCEVAALEEAEMDLEARARRYVEGLAADGVIGAEYMLDKVKQTT